MEWHLLSSRQLQSRRFRTVEILQTFSIQYPAIDPNVPNEPVNVFDAFVHLEQCLREIIQPILDDLNPTDFIRVALHNRLLHHDVFLSFRERQVFDITHLLDYIRKVLNSNEAFLLEGVFTLSVVTVRVPPLAMGRAATPFGIDRYLRCKRSVIAIQNPPGDELCAARALTVAIAYRTGDPTQIRRLRDARRPAQREAAEALHRRAGIPIGPCGLEHIERFQQYLHPLGYQVIVFSSMHCNAIIHRGREAPQQLYLLLVEDSNTRCSHFHVIRSVTGFLQRSYFCTFCLVGYQNRTYHRYCRQKCTQCLGNDQHRGPATPCQTCHRTFYGADCFATHVRIRTCPLLFYCSQCDTTLDMTSRPRAYKTHSCGEAWCGVCKQYTTERPHWCFIPTLPTKQAPDSPLLYCIYDIETRMERQQQQSVSVLVPNMIACLTFCTVCWQQDSCIWCTFRGERTFDDVEAFAAWVTEHLQNSGRRVRVLAHNGAAFDTIFVMRAFLSNCVPVSVVKQGTRVVSMTLPASRVRFLDTFRFLPIALRDLPQCFELEQQKHWFPWLANIETYGNYRGKPLPPSLYNESGMREKEREAFWIFYRGLTTFDFRQDLERYCLQDVRVLAACVMKFRELFMAVAQGVDPFEDACTLPSAIMQLYRREHLPERTLGAMPVNGYVPDRKRSYVANEWLHYVEQCEQLTLLREVAIGKGLTVDGLHVPTRVVYTFKGCIFHACSRCVKYDRFRLNPFTRKSYADTRGDDQRRDEMITRLGYTLVVMWECDWRKQVRDLNIPKVPRDRRTLFPPLEVRHAYYGAQTEVYKLFAESTLPHRKIQALDAISLYPWVMKSQRFPIGHPTIVQRDFTPNLEGYHGFVQCLIQPPQSLYYPVLPYRTSDGRLTFPLCAQCAETKNQQPCTHTDVEQRALYGTWTTFEVRQALDLDYRLCAVYEVYDYAVSEPGALFASFVNTFLKLKTEASGWPDSCISDEDRRLYIADFRNREGIELDPTRIRKNPGLRTVCKISLNSLYGKLGERPHKQKTEFIVDPSRLISLLQSVDITLVDLAPLGEQMVQVDYVPNPHCPTDTVFGAVQVASWITAYGRMYLQDHLRALGPDRTIYTDTDGLIFSQGPHEHVPPTGSSLGDLTSDLGSPQAYIETFLCIAPKSYGYRVVDPSQEGAARVRTVLRMKGITLDHRTVQTVNLHSLKDLVEEAICCCGRDEGSPQKVLTVTEPYQIRRASHAGPLTSNAQQKEIRVTKGKRVLRPDFSTVPFGYRTST